MQIIYQFYYWSIILNLKKNLSYFLRIEIIAI